MADPVYERSDLHIELIFDPSGWEWYLVETYDDQIIASGKAESIQTAAADACRAFDAACTAPPAP